MIRKLLAGVGVAVALTVASVLPGSVAQAAPQRAASVQTAATAEDGTVYLWQCVQAGGAGITNLYGGAPSQTGMWCHAFLPQGYLLPIALDPEYGYCLPGTTLSINWGIFISYTCKPV
ncbi:hypothetical protein GCM10010435_23830 [Winogradskya consettensis]|uniref:Secreted protein n=1 Tax=Winogradskya consettensis TaxID=113560 RepID=A0A919VZQ2_9ACTN|nr:hypothetical protein [Actinoplanes consettensis]GIM82382.1 hypothetical protein Aco04nite_81230 [Actinoplanes consettensis]